MRKTVFLALFVFLLLPMWAQPQDYTSVLRRCSQNEKEALQNPQRFQFLERVLQDWGSETRSVIETRDGRVDRIIAFNDEPLATDQQKKQQERLTRLLNSDDALHKEVADQREEAGRRQQLVATMPEAFLFEFVARDADGLKFSFLPNPQFSPSNRETQVFKGMRGVVWINPQYERIVRVEGELFKDVSFGWGILGRLYKGGTFEVVQSQVSPGVWRITTLNLDFQGRAFLFNSLKIFRKESSTGFVPTPDGVTARSGIAQLLSKYKAVAGITRFHLLPGSFRDRKCRVEEHGCFAS
jgi:hypothetical protein